MMIWIGLILLICAGFSAYAGASQLEQAKQHAKCSLNAFTLCHSGIQKLLVEGSAGVLESSVTVEQWVSIWIFQNSFIKRIRGRMVCQTERLPTNAMRLACVFLFVKNAPAVHQV